MAAPILRPQPATRESGPAPLTADQAYWRTFKNQLQIPSPHNAAITSVTTGAQDTFAVTSAGRIQIFSTKTRKVVKTISRFGVDDTARSGVLRRDGRVLLAGGDSGVVQAFDTSSRAILKQWNRGLAAQKRQAVHCVRWNPSVLTQFMTTCDDRTVQVWDLTEDEPMWTGIGHEDYVRSGCYLPGQESLVVSGSYDQTVRVWDTRQDRRRNAMVFKHAAPVEDVIALNSSTIAAAAGNEVSILNLAAGKADHIIRSHQKAVTSLSTAYNGSRILTGALDGHVKVHDTTNWQVVAGFKYQSPILSVATITLSTEDRHLAIGQQNGLLSVRTRLAGAEKSRTREKEARMQALLEGTADEYERKQRKKDSRQGIRARDRGKDFTGEGADIVIAGQDRKMEKRLRPWQTMLRKGQYADALDEVLLPSSNTKHAGTKAGESGVQLDDVLTLVIALRHRSALRTALANREASELLPVLRWTLKYVNTPQHLPLVYDMLLMILDLYSAKLGEWQDEDGEAREAVSLVERIGKRVRKGTELAQQCQGVQGMLELLAAG